MKALILCSVLVAILSCEQEFIYLDISERENIIENTYEEVGDCGYTICDIAIAATKEQYQGLANSLCDTVWVDITCCQDGFVTYALVLVAPDHRLCNKGVEF